MAQTRVRTCTAGDRTRASLEASLRRYLATSEEKAAQLPLPPVGGEVVKPIR